MISGLAWFLGLLVIVGLLLAMKARLRRMMAGVLHELEESWR